MASIRFPSTQFFFAKNLAATVAAAKPGDEIILDSGVYDEAIAFDKPLTLSGAAGGGEVVLTGGVKIGPTGPVTLQNLTLACKSGAGLEARGTTTLRVMGVTLRHCKSGGLSLSAVVDAQISDCVFDGNLATGLEATDSSGVVRDCKFALNKFSSIMISGGKFNIAAGEISAPEKHAIYFRASAVGEVANCMFASAAATFSPVCATESANLVVTKCEFRNLTIAGVFAPGNARTRIDAYVFKDCRDRGVVAKGQAQVTVRKSQFGPLAQAALDASGQAKATVPDCVFSDCAPQEASVRVQSRASVSLTKSRFEKSGRILAFDGGSATLRDCRLVESIVGIEASG
jgi:hypothetical protein